MKRDRNNHSLFSINADIDKTGRIRGYFALPTPIEGNVCVWPRFPILPPPMTAEATLEKFTLGFYSV